MQAKAGLKTGTQREQNKTKNKTGSKLHTNRCVEAEINCERRGKKGKGKQKSGPIR